jgi:hypothetical protein
MVGELLKCRRVARPANRARRAKADIAQQGKKNVGCASGERERSRDLNNWQDVASLCDDATVGSIRG